MKDKKYSLLPSSVFQWDARLVGDRKRKQSIEGESMKYINIFQRDKQGRYFYGVNTLLLSYKYNDRYVDGTQSLFWRISALLIDLFSESLIMPLGEQLRDLTVYLSP